MRFRSRLLLLASPLLAFAGRLPAQPTSQTQANDPPGGESAQEVQVGAGTQGDVTNGSSGPRKKPAGNAAAAPATGSTDNNANNGASAPGNSANRTGAGTSGGSTASGSAPGGGQSPAATQGDR
jgi:hypothetical protein